MDKGEGNPPYQKIDTRRRDASNYNRSIIIITLKKYTPKNLIIIIHIASFLGRQTLTRFNLTRVFLPFSQQPNESSLVCP